MTVWKAIINAFRVTRTTAIMVPMTATRAWGLGLKVPDDLEVFDKRKAPVVDVPLVTLQAKGNFSFNAAAIAALGNPEGLEYVYSPSEKVLGFRAADPNEPHAYRIRKQPNSLNYQSAGIAFRTHYGLPTGQALRHRAELVGDTLFVDLKESAQDVTHKRKKGSGNGDDGATPRG